MQKTILGQVLGQVLRPVLNTRYLTDPGVGGGGAFSPLSLFAAGEQGAWYDPSDFTRYIREKGPELITNGDFSGGATGWTLGSTWAISGGVATVNNPGSFSALVSNAAVVIGKWYEMTFTVVSISAGSIAVRMGAGGFGSTATAAGTYTSRLQCAISASAYLQVTADTIATVDNISVRELTAINTATMFQDSVGTIPVTAVGQPVGLILDKRLGLVRGPEVVPDPEINNPAAWVTNSPGTVITSGGKVTFTNATVGNNWKTEALVTQFGKTYEMVVDVESISSGSLRAFISLGLSDPVVLNVGVNRMVLTHKGSTSTPGIYAAAASTSAVVRSISVRELPGNHASQATSAARPVLQQDGNGSYYLAFDGVDDFLSTGSIDFTATDKMTVVAGVMTPSASGQIVCELSSGVASNVGSFYFVAGTDGVYDTSLARGSAGAVSTQMAGFATASTGTAVVRTATHDIAGDLSAARRNGVAGTSGTGDKGGGNFGNYPLYIGRRGGTSLPFNGHLYQLTVRGAMTADLAPIETFTADKTGVTLP